MEKQKAIICDLDGTLANVKHRLHFIKEGKKDWKSFFSHGVHDTCDEYCLSLVRKAQAAGQEIIFLTGRPAYLSRDTVKWIKDQTGISTELNKTLFMRPSGNRKQDTVVKEEIYLRDIAPHYEIVLALDDKPEILDIWKKYSIETIRFDHK